MDLVKLRCSQSLCSHSGFSACKCSCHCTVTQMQIPPFLLLSFKSAGLSRMTPEPNRKPETGTAGTFCSNRNRNRTNLSKLYRHAEKTLPQRNCQNLEPFHAQTVTTLRTWKCPTHFRKILMSVNLLSAILGPETAAPISWAPRTAVFLLQENPPCPQNSSF